MQCANAKRALEIAPNRLSLPLLIHLAGCPQCRAHRQRIALLYSTARMLPQLEMPASLGADFAPVTDAPQRGLLGVRLAVGAIVVVVAAGVGLLAGPRFAPIPVSAATVRDAIRATNTWHFSGWRMKDGKKETWEVWGRRSPFFLQERIGDEVLLDDGTQRIHIIPPNQRGLHRPGLFLKMPSHPLAAEKKGSAMNPYDTLSGFLCGIGADLHSRLYEGIGKSNRRTVTLEATLITGMGGMRDGDERGVRDLSELLVDRETRLPIRFDLRRALFRDPKFFEKPPTEREKSKEKEWIQATLTAQYNVALPTGVTELTAPADYVFIDFSKKPDLPDKPEFGVTSVNGLTVAMRVLAQDLEGSTRLQSIVRLGATRPDWTTMLMRVEVAPSYNFEAFTTAKQYPRDEQGNVYLTINQPDADWDRNFRYATPEVPQMTYEIDYLTPAEPLLSNRPRPKSLTIPLRVTVYIDEPMEGGGNVSHSSRAIVQERMTITVPLPERITPLDYDRSRGNPEGIGWESPNQRTLLEETSQMRSVYWSEKGDPTRNPMSGESEHRENRAKAVYWGQLNVKEAERLKDKRRIDGARRNLEFFRRDAAK